MNTFARLIPVEPLSGPKVRYYTIELQHGEAEWSTPESDDFFNRHEDIDRLADMVDEMFVWLDEMAHYTGAKLEFFRNERNALALPPENAKRKYLGRHLNVAYQEYNTLRLYLIRLNGNVVILLNGGEKTSRIPEDCPNVRAHFLRAQRIAMAIDDAMVAGDIQYNKDQTDIIFDQDFEISIP